MMLARVLRNLFRAAPAAKPPVAPSAPPAAPALRPPAPGERRVLDVGSGSREIPLPLHFAGWTRLLLDIDPGMRPDLALDARELARLGPALFDAVYCSHNLEHYYAHDVGRILQGFVHVLKPGGFVEVRVPDLAAVAREFTAAGRELDGVLYDSPAGPITARDVIYGLERWIESSGKDFFAHKTGFTRSTLERALGAAGLSHVHWLEPLGPYEIHAVALAAPPDERTRDLLSLQVPG